MTTPALDPQYEKLLRKVQPRVPHSKKEHDYLLGEIEALMLKGEDNLSSAESALLELIVSLAHEFEQKTYPLEFSDSAEILQFLMEQNGTKAADLPIPASRVSEILHGKREVSKSQAIDLGAFFKVSPALFIALK